MNCQQPTSSLMSVLREDALQLQHSRLTGRVCNTAGTDPPVMGTPLELHSAPTHLHVTTGTTRCHASATSHLLSSCCHPTAPHM